ncbi:MAG: hypothetical protein B7Z22_02610, partial [Hyphomonas sp. 32-62-5]
MRYRVKSLQADMSMAVSVVDADTVDDVRRQVQALGNAVVSISREGGLGAGARGRKDFPLL